MKRVHLTADLTLRQLGDEPHRGCLSVISDDSGDIAVSSHGRLPRLKLRQLKGLSQQVSRFVNHSGQSVTWLHQENTIIAYRPTKFGGVKRSVHWLRLVGVLFSN